MDAPITYQMLSAVMASLVVVGGAWFFIERRIKEIDLDLRSRIDRLDLEGSLQTKSALAELSLLRETLYTKYVSHEQLIRLEERLISELRELRRSLDKRNQYYQPKNEDE
jgi:hypothetical protein